MGIYLLYNSLNDANLRVISSVISIINIEIKNALNIKNTFLGLQKTTYLTVTALFNYLNFIYSEN
jgi:hypothetical protein